MLIKLLEVKKLKSVNKILFFKNNLTHDKYYKEYIDYKDDLKENTIKQLFKKKFINYDSNIYTIKINKDILSKNCVLYINAFSDDYNYFFAGFEVKINEECIYKHIPKTKKKQSKIKLTLILDSNNFYKNKENDITVILYNIL